MKVPPLYYHLKCNTSTVDVTSVCFHLVNSQSPLFGFEKSSPFENDLAFLDFLRIGSVSPKIDKQARPP